MVGFPSQRALTYRAREISHLWYDSEHVTGDLRADVFGNALGDEACGLQSLRKRRFYAERCLLVEFCFSVSVSKRSQGSCVPWYGLAFYDLDDSRLVQLLELDIPQECQVQRQEPVEGVDTGLKLELG